MNDDGSRSTASLVGLLGACVSSILGQSALAAAPGNDQASPTPSDPSANAAGATAGSASAQTAAGTDAGHPLAQVTVNGVRSLLHDKLAEDAQHAPQSVSVVSREVISSRADTRLADVLKNVPGITLNAGEGAARGDTVNLRGFSAFNDFFLDGVRDAAVYTRDSFDLQSVEVVKGPSAVLFGRGLDGRCDQSGDQGAVSDGTRRGHDAVRHQQSVSLYGRFEYADPDRLRLRRAPKSHGRGFQDRRARRRAQSPLGRRTVAGVRHRRPRFLHARLSAPGRAQHPGRRRAVHLRGLPSVPPVPRDGFYGLVSNRATADDDIVTGRYRHEFSENVSLADTVRYANYDYGNIFDAPNFGTHPPTRGEPLTSIFVGRDAPSSLGVQTNLDEQLDLTARFDTGEFAHTLVAGLEIARQSSLIQRYANPFNSNNNWITPTPLLDPNAYQVSPVEPITSTQHTIAPSGGAYVLDTVGFGQYVALTGGYRYDYFSADFRQVTLTSGAKLHLTELNRLASPRAALMVTPTPHQTYYFSYGTSFDPSAEALTLTAKTANLGPREGQYL